LALVATAYGVGRFHNASLLRAQHASLEASETDRGLLEARRSLALVALALDRRNFGVAEKHRRDAIELLERPPVSRLQVDDIASAIRTLDLSVSPDPGAHRDRVITACEALDSVLATRAAAGS